jgi:hypothetical protein
MAKYLLLKHYRGGPTPVQADGGLGLEGATPEEYQAHIAFMGKINDMLQESGEFVDAQGLAPTGTFVRYGGPDAPPVTDGPFAETKDLIAGWWVVDVESEARAHEIAAYASSAPGKRGEPIYEWIEVRPFMANAPESFDEIIAQL